MTAKEDTLSPAVPLSHLSPSALVLLRTPLSQESTSTLLLPAEALASVDCNLLVVEARLSMVMFSSTATMLFSAPADLSWASLLLFKLMGDFAWKGWRSGME